MTRLRIVIDRELCIGVGTCIEVAPRVFGLDGDAKATAPAEVEGPAGKVLDAAQACPVQAITVVDAATGAALFPRVVAAR